MLEWTPLRLWRRSNGQAILILATFTLMAAGVGLLYASSMSCPALDSKCSVSIGTTPLATLTTMGVSLVPVVAGLTFGVGVVGAEIEARTVAFSWSLAIDRRHWLADRAAGALVSIIALGLLSGLLNFALVGMLNPNRDLLNSFAGYGLWGPILVVRGFCAFAIGVAVGAAVGRVVAGFSLGLLLVGTVLPLAILGGWSLEPTQVLRNDDPRIVGSMRLESGVLDPTGQYTSLMECSALAPEGLDSANEDAWVGVNCPGATRVIPGSHMPWVELRESVALAACGLLFLALGAAIVMRRRP